MELEVQRTLHLQSFLSLEKYNKLCIYKHKECNVLITLGSILLRLFLKYDMDVRQWRIFKLQMKTMSALLPDIILHYN